MDQDDLERLAQDVRARAGVLPEVVLASLPIARRLLGPGAVRCIPRFGAAGLLVPMEGRYRIFVRSEAEDRNFVIAHELGHWALRLAMYDGAREEEFADRIGAAIVAPPAAVRAAYHFFGENLSALAKHFGSTQSLVVLRLAEVLCQDRALLSPERARVLAANGPLATATPEELRAWAKGRSPKGIRKAHLRSGYDRGRVAFRGF